VAAADVDHTGDVLEVDDLGDVCVVETGRLLVPVDGDDAMAELPCPVDRPALVPAGPHEEDCCHERRC
jgi:hypothetical protein